MKIVNIMLGKGLGGIEQSALDYAAGLTDISNEVLFITHPDAAINQLAAKENITVKHLSNYGAWDWWAAYRLQKLCQSYGADILITHGNRALSLAARFADKHVPCVTVAHNYHMQHFHKADAILCITDHVKQAILKRYPDRSPETCFHSPNMIKACPPRAKLDWSTPPRIGAIGRMVKKKGFDVWLHALADLKQRGYQFDAWLAGEGEEKQALEMLAEQLGLQDHVMFKGWVEHAHDFYHDIDIFCLPSHHEPFGIVVIEAMAARLPVIATKSEGPVEIITDAAHGVLVDKGAAAQMADALQMLLDKSGEARKIGNQAYDHVVKHYERSVLSERLVSILQEIVR